MLTEKEMDTKVCSKCREVKLLEEFNKRTAKKDGYRSECKACKKEYQAEYYEDNPEKLREYSAEYRAANPEKVKDRKDKYRAANPEKCKARVAKWAKANPEKGRARNSNRRAAKLKAIPKWLTKDDYKLMESIGEEADRLTRETGIKHEVDHIHPLRGKLICGLQCPTNLQILTMIENRSKGNKFTPYVESA